jgi:hypothetical protein
MGTRGRGRVYVYVLEMGCSGVWLGRRGYILFSPFSSSSSSSFVHLCGCVHLFKYGYRQCFCH